MGKGEPIHCQEDIDRLKKYFLSKNEPRNYALVVMAVNTAFKVTELLHLRWKDVYDFGQNVYRQEIQILCPDSGRQKAAFVNEEIIKSLEAVRGAAESILPEHYIFQSRKGTNSPISRGRAFTIIKEAARELEMQENISCESLRKTFGYQAWKQGIQPEYLQAVYRQASRSVTERYLGIDDGQKEPSVLKVQV